MRGKAFAYDIKNSLVAEIVYNPDKKGLLSFGKKATTDDFFRGSIYKMNETLKVTLITKYFKKNMSKFPGLKEKEDVKEELS